MIIHNFVQIMTLPPVFIPDFGARGEKAVRQGQDQRLNSVNNGYKRWD